MFLRNSFLKIEKDYIILQKMTLKILPSWHRGYVFWETMILNSLQIKLYSLNWAKPTLAPSATLRQGICADEFGVAIQGWSLCIDDEDMEDVCLAHCFDTELCGASSFGDGPLECFDGEKQCNMHFLVQVNENLPPSNDYWSPLNGTFTQMNLKPNMWMSNS